MKNGQTGRIVPLAELRPLNEAEEQDYLADIGERLDNQTLTDEEAADLIFGPAIAWPYPLQISSR